MSDPLAPVTAGQPLQLRAPTWNAMLDAARAHRRGTRPPDAPRPRLAWGGVIEALALNDTGADLGEHKPCSIDRDDLGGIDVAATPFEWQRKPVFTLIEPTGTSSFVVVTLEAIPDGEYGRIAIAGAVLCDVEILDAAHDFAHPAASDTTRLHSSASGAIRILGKPSGAGSTKRCAVSLDSQIPESARTVAFASSLVAPTPVPAVVAGTTSALTVTVDGVSAAINPSLIPMANLRPGALTRGSAPNGQLSQDSTGLYWTDTAARAHYLAPIPTLSDAAAPNNQLYYSSTTLKLSYKDPGGTVNACY